MSNMPLWERYLGKPLLDLHDTIYNKTEGRIGHRIPLPGMAPMLLLRTVGAKTDDPDYPRLFEIVNKNNHNVYEGYQKRTTRPISVVVLTPQQV
jgi:hypothetical protein